MSETGKISIHTTLAGGDRADEGRNQILFNFNPHHPRGWRPVHLRLYRHGQHFNPHHPRGWRLETKKHTKCDCHFNPHHPRGWRPADALIAAVGIAISIHTTLAGGDPTQVHTSSIYPHFNPHHPRGWRQKGKDLVARRTDFNPHHPRGWRLFYWLAYSGGKHFNPHHPRGWRLDSNSRRIDRDNFNPHHPRGWRQGFLRMVYTLS